MNFLPATVEADVLRTPLGDLPLDDRLRGALARANAPRHAILGVRPEHFEDAGLPDAPNRARGLRYRGEVDVLESMGSDKYAYFSLPGDQARSPALDELAADTGTADLASAPQLVARLPASSAAREGEPLDVWFPAAHAHLFDPTDGRNLTLEAGPIPA
jgi:multiple sugar transport system ATP-binding protein